MSNSTAFASNRQVCETLHSSKQSTLHNLWSILDYKSKGTSSLVRIRVSTNSELGQQQGARWNVVHLLIHHLFQHEGSVFIDSRRLRVFLISIGDLFQVVYVSTLWRRRYCNRGKTLPHGRISSPGSHHGQKVTMDNWKTTTQMVPASKVSQCLVRGAE